MVSETYNWFARSATRQASYKKVYRLINDGHDPLKIVKACRTRWLSISSAVDRVIDQYLELQTHFSIASANERCVNTDLLVNVYKDPSNFAYLVFLRPILNEINAMNKVFESRDADFCLLFNQLKSLIRGLCKKIVNITSTFDAMTSNIRNCLIPKPYLGYAFEQFIAKSVANREMTQSTEDLIRLRCVDFLIDLISQLRQRLLHNIDILEKISMFSPSITLLQHFKPNIINICEMFKLPVKKIESIENQWSNIHFER